MKNSFFIAINFAVLIYISIFYPTAKAETTFAIVVGIDEYQNKRNLLGAVNDAKDIQASLLQAGITNITTLINKQANRNNIDNIWKKTVNEAKPNDRIIFTYAGHGGQIKDINGDEKINSPADTLDETFILSAFDENSPINNREQIVDDELNRWIRLATDKQVNVLFIADSCHSGDGYRQLTVRGRSRAAPINWNAPPLLEDAITAPPVSEDDLSGRLMFISGSKSSQEVKEVIDNQTGLYRGALSMAFSKALSQADYNKDGGVSVDEIVGFISSETKNNTEKNQTPTFAPTRGNNLVFRQASSAVLPHTRQLKKLTH